MHPQPGLVTSLLTSVHKGDPQALSEVCCLVFPELRRLAQMWMAGERQGHTLQPTALVSEAFLRLFDGEPQSWTNSREFILAASGEMRRVLTDHSRRLNARKRAHLKVQPGDLDYPDKSFPLDAVVEIDAALSALSRLESRAALVVELRFFAGLENDEIASLLALNVRTIEREWAWARSWLFRHLTKPAGAATHVPRPHTAG